MKFISENIVSKFKIPPHSLKAFWRNATDIDPYIFISHSQPRQFLSVILQSPHSFLSEVPPRLEHMHLYPSHLSCFEISDLIFSEILFHNARMMTESLIRGTVQDSRLMSFFHWTCYLVPITWSKHQMILFIIYYYFFSEK